MAYFFALKRSRKKDAALIFLFIGLLSFVLLTQSRNPLVSLGTASLLLLWMHRSKYILYFFLILCSVLIIYFSINFYQLVGRDLSDQHEIWSITIEKIRLKPIFGHDLGSSIQIESTNLKKVLSDTHNLYLGLTYKL